LPAPESDRRSRALRRPPRRKALWRADARGRARPGRHRGGDPGSGRLQAPTNEQRMTDLLVRGGAVVTATGSARADVLVREGSIQAIESDLGELDEGGAVEVVDATRLLVLPGAVDVHTHTRVATDAEPDRFFQDSMAAAFGGTTTFLAFNNPG